MLIHMKSMNHIESTRSMYLYARSVSQYVNEVYHEPEAASCVSGITWHVNCVCGKIVFKFLFRGITVTIAILNETIVTFIGF